MVSIRPFNSETDFNGKPFEVQDEQKGELNLRGFEDREQHAFVLENEKEVLAIVFFIQMSEGRYLVCSYISKNAGPYFIEMKTLVERLFNFYGALRYEATVRSDFEQGHRMITLLGFEHEGTMRKFQNGIDYDLYARIK